MLWTHTRARARIREHEIHIFELYGAKTIRKKTKWSETAATTLERHRMKWIFYLINDCVVFSRCAQLMIVNEWTIVKHSFDDKQTENEYATGWSWRWVSLQCFARVCIWSFGNQLRATKVRTRCVRNVWPIKLDQHPRNGDDHLETSLSFLFRFQSIVLKMSTFCEDRDTMSWNAFPKYRRTRAVTILGLICVLCGSLNFPKNWEFREIKFS